MWKDVLYICNNFSCDYKKKIADETTLKASVLESQTKAIFNKANTRRWDEALIRYVKVLEVRVLLEDVSPQQTLKDGAAMPLLQ